MVLDCHSRFQLNKRVFRPSFCVINALHVLVCRRLSRAWCKTWTAIYILSRRTRYTISLLMTWMTLEKHFRPSGSALPYIFFPKSCTVSFIMLIVTSEARCALLVLMISAFPENMLHKLKLHNVVWITSQRRRFGILKIVHLSLFRRYVSIAT